MTPEPKPDFLKGPPVPEWMVKEAEKFRRLVAAGIFVHVPMSEAEKLADPDYDL